MLFLQFGDNGPPVVALQILLNRDDSTVPKLVTDGDFGGKTRTAVDVFRDQIMAQSGPAGIADPAMMRFLVDGAGLQTVDSVDVTDPTVAEIIVPALSRVTLPVLLGGMSNGVAQLITDVQARVQGERSLMMLRMHGHGSPGLAAISHGSRRVSPGIDPFGNQTVIAQQIMPALTSQLKQLGPLFANFGFVELHSCRVAEGVQGERFVRDFADALGAPVRAAVSKQQAENVFTLTGKTFTGIPGGGSVRDWGLSRDEGISPADLALAALQDVGR